ncbi:hypothetical protein, variant [Aphanomyces invadans]|uniref:HECT-type E3 ubiquitin transferase n=1 Tax=Aphanomyces invadans TaxID=157072 RepID=A0A024UAL1_9STRA|nr:hypothetical protein, variant [Aphanomyces invadans]ETW03314.1 hypothetical protein, variant [Aphanomyces invadans]|eukprot:XP_008867543.1 hypothetical protein, variant [Aphanomyces invadans]
MSRYCGKPIVENSDSSYTPAIQGETKGTVDFCRHLRCKPDSDGEEGSPGTVERISTWGGVQGSGITVRWDKNQRMNTYRWGAEGCFDIQIIEEDASGNILTHKPIKMDNRSGGAAGKSTPAQHEFVVYKYDPTTLESYLDQSDQCMREMLHLPTGVKKDDKPEKSFSASLPHFSHTHEHPVGESDSKTPWVCDGHQTSCVGSDGVRYRCLTGCDFDLCAACLAVTTNLADVVPPISADDVVDELPFSLEDDEFFKVESMPTMTEDARVDQDDLLAELQQAWQGQFGSRECAVALLKHDYNVQQASEWLVTSGTLLKRRCVIPVRRSLVLEQNNLTLLDPVLLIAGSFYTTGKQLGIVVPGAICHVEPSKRRRQGDILNVFSMASGTLLADVHQSVAVSGGSPMCYDHIRDRVIGHEFNSSVMLEFTNIENAVPVDTSAPALTDPGGFILHHLVRIVGLRHRLEPTYFPLKTIEMHIQQLEAGKPKRRQVVKLKARLEMMKKLVGSDPRQGYFLPFCPTVTCLPALSSYIVHAVQARWSPDVVNNWLYLLVGFLEEAMSADITSFGDFDAESLEDTLVQLCTGECGEEYIASTSRLAQRALLWGMNHQVFFASPEKLQASLAKWCNSLELSRDNMSYALLMPLSHPTRTYPDASAVKAGFTGSILRTFASSSIFLQRLTISPQVWISALLSLNKKEHTILDREPKTLSPTQRLLFSITAYMLQQPLHLHVPWMIETVLTECKAYFNEDDRQFRTSLGGTLLPLIVAGLAHRPELANTLLPTLEDLLLSMDAVVATLPKCQHADAAYKSTELTGFLSPAEVAESPHPYGLGVPTFRKQLHFSQATALDLEFDHASCTVNSNDFAFVTSNPHTNLDRLCIDHAFQGDKYFHGPSPWPTSSLAGDAATIVLCATTHPDDNANEKLRYGIKCQARGYFAMRMPALLRTQHALAQLISNLARQLVADESTQDVSKQYLDALSACTSLPENIVAIANNVDHPFVNRLEKQFGRIFLRKSIEWRRCTMACLAVLLGVSKVDIDTVDVTDLRSVVQGVSDLQRFMMKHSQIEIEWAAFLTDQTPKDGVIERLVGNEELLQGLCSYLQLQEQTPEAIYAKLEGARGSGDVLNLPSIIQLVEDRARLLLNQRKVHSNDNHNPSVSLDTVVKFLQSSVVPTEINKVIAIHKKNANRRLSGLNVLHNMLGLKSLSTRQLFMGALLQSMTTSTQKVAISDNCELCGSELMAQLEDGLKKYLNTAKSLCERSSTLYSHKVMLGLELTAFASNEPHDSFMLPQVIHLLRDPPVWSLPNALNHFANAVQAKDAFSRNVKGYSEVLWMVLRRLLRTAVEVPLAARLEMCHALFQFVSTAHEKARILDLVRGIVDRNCTLTSNWTTTIGSLVDFGHSPMLLRAVRRLFDQLAAPQDTSLVRRILHGIGTCLSVERPACPAKGSDSFGTVLYWTNSANEALIKLVALLDDQLHPEIPSWNISVDATSLAKQQHLLDTSIIHRYVQCDGCGLNPLVGHRFKCRSCSNYDLCTVCYVGNVHDLDHVFLRCSDTSGNSDQLPPRISESLSGSRLWKSTLLHSELQAKGFAVLLLSSEAECTAMAEKITSSLNLSCSVTGLEQIRRLQSLAPEKSAASTPRNTMAAAINAAAEPLDVHSIKQDLASDFIALVRKWLTPSSKTFGAVVACLKLVPGFSKGSKTIADMYEGIGAVAVLGGTVEHLREGGYVTWNHVTAQVRTIFQHQLNLQLSCGRVETKVQKAEVVPVSEVEIDAACAKLFLEVLYVFDDILQEIDSWIKSDEVCTFKSDVSWRVLKALHVLVPLWPSVSDNQVLALYGCIPPTLMALAQKCPVSMQFISTELGHACEMAWLYLRKMHHFVALSPFKSHLPIPSPLNLSTQILDAEDDTSATYWYNMYSYATLADLPQHPGRNKLLDHWERHVIPAIQKYVRGSFKSYEMDYFFAQLREPLREGNNAAARRIAHTLCDGHVPPGCLFPDNNADWTALQWDDLAIGSTYRIELDVASAPPGMGWCQGHWGTIALIDPASKLALLQVINPDTASLQHWWLSVSQLQGGDVARPPVSMFADQVLQTMHVSSSRAVYKLARDCVFAIVRKCPEFVRVDLGHSLQRGYALSDLLAVAADEWSPMAVEKSHSIKDAIQFLQATSHVLPVVPKPKQKKSKEVIVDDAVAFKDMAKFIGSQVSVALNKAMEHHKSYVVTSASPPEPLVHLHLPDVSWMVLTFFVHPVLMDLPAGSCMEIFFDEGCTQLIRGYYGGRKGLSKLPPLWVPSNSCYIKMSISEYARYKVRVDGIHGTLGVATWLNDLLNDPNQWCTFLDLCNWPPLVQQIAFAALIPKMPRTVSPSLAYKLKEQWKAVFAEERPVYSTYAQQLVEMLTVVHSDTEDVIQSFRRMTKFADAFTDARTKEGVVGRVPVDEIKAMVDRMRASDFYTDRLLILQKLPKTSDIDGLVKAVSKWVVHLSLECCGEADDQSMFSATDVTRFGILARILYCPTDSSGFSIGYCVVDVGRDDIIDKLMASLTDTPFYFEGEHTEDDPELMAFIHLSEKSESSSSAAPSMWACASCTFENNADSTVCNLCGTLNPNKAASPPESDASTNAPGPSDGWTCSACTFLNDWNNSTCSICGSECDQERILTSLDSQSPVDGIAPLDGGNVETPSTTSQHRLSVLTFKAAYNAGHSRDPRVNDILNALVPRSTAAELIASADVPTCPRERYVELRSKGYDLQLTFGSFTSLQQALVAMGKWTFAMDVQLIDAALQQCHRIGLPNLTQMSVSHLGALVDTQHSLLTALSLPELRLRFLILQQWNVLLSETLSLVDFHHVGVGAKLVKLRKLIFPGVKIRFFNLVQDNTTQGGEKKPTVTIDRLLWKRDPSVSLFEFVQNQLMAVNPLSLRAKRPLGASDPFIAFSVDFMGENVVGEGGPYRQLFSDIAHECFRLNLFLPTPNSTQKLGSGRDMVLPRPSATSRHDMEQYEFVGLLMGCCLRTGVHLPLRLAPLIWKMLVHQPVVAAELKQVDQALHDSLISIQTDATLLEALTFTTALSDGHVVELVPGGHTKPVTKENVAEYVRLVTKTRLEECRPQVDAILRGVGKIFPLQLLPLCTWTELQQWIGGSQVIDIDLLKRHTKYAAGMTVEAYPHLEYFWQVLHGFSEEDKRRFINFAWGQESLPADDAEFDRTRTRLLIKPPTHAASHSQDSLLPKADTCFFNIELPAYSSVQVMKDKLHLAINLCMSMDADDPSGRMDVYFEGE